MVQIFLCDDDPAFVQQLSQMLEDLARGYGEKVEIRQTVHPRQILPEQLRDVDIAFLDIDMGQVNGIDLARALRRAGCRALLIFATNYPEYAPEGYEVSAFRFLDKSRLAQKLPYYFSQALNALHRRQDQVLLRWGREEACFPACCLVWAETSQRRLLLHMTQYHTSLLPCGKKMMELEQQLAPLGFLRVHQSFLVNMQYIRKLQSTGVALTTGEVLPVSARNYQKLKGTLLAWRAKHPWNIY